MDPDHPLSVDTSGAIKEIGDALSSIRDEFKQKQPLSVMLADKLAINLKKLGSEASRLYIKLQFHVGVIRSIEEDARADQRLYVDYPERVDLLLGWGDIIGDMLIDISLSTPTISSLSHNLQTVFLPLFSPPPSIGGPKPTLDPIQRRLRGLYEITLESVTSLALAKNYLSNILSAFAVGLLSATASSAAANCFRSLIRSSHSVPKGSFGIALKSARRLAALSARLILHDNQEKEQMGWYVSKIFILLRVMESYFYSPRLKHRCDILGNPERWNGRRGFPIAGVGVFEAREIGGILAGVVGVEILLKVGAMWPGFGADVLGVVERRIKMLKRCLVLMWKKELAWIGRVKWLESPARVVRRVERKAGKGEEEEGEGEGEERGGKESVTGPTDVPETSSEVPGWETQAAKRAFQTHKVREASPVAKGNTYKRGRDDHGIGKTLAATGGIGIITLDDWEVHAARGASQTPGTKKKSTKEAGTPVPVGRTEEVAVMGETAAETVQVAAEAGGKKKNRNKQKKKKKNSGREYGGAK